MAKDKAKKQSARKKANDPKKTKKLNATPAGRAKVARASGPTKVAKVAKRAKAKAADLATHPAVAEIVAATLVAAAAALKNPQKARDMATAVSSELETASKEAVDRGGRLWQLALDIARRSIDTLENDKSSGKSKAKAKKSTAK